jgi:hypothetical protein
MIFGVFYSYMTNILKNKLSGIFTVKTGKIKNKVQKEGKNAYTGFFYTVNPGNRLLVNCSPIYNNVNEMGKK